MPTKVYVALLHSFASIKALRFESPDDSSFAMKFTTSMLALAGSALANQPVPRDDYDYGYEADVTYTTYTTVTTCPVTSTYTEKGT